jgi:hypothetical protein
MMIGGSTAPVTGANRGLGKALVRALLEAGCAKVYAGARNVEGVAPDRLVQPLQLDITKADQVAAAAARCGDVDILINNAGVAGFTPVLACADDGQRPPRDRDELSRNAGDVPCFCSGPRAQRRRRIGERALGRELVQRSDRALTVRRRRPNGRSRGRYGSSCARRERCWLPSMQVTSTPT